MKHQSKRGTELPQAKLSESDVQLIRRLHKHKQEEIKRLNETLSAKALAEKFGVHARTIEKVLTYRGWVHVQD